MLEIATSMDISVSADRVYHSFVSADKIGNFWFSQSSADWEVGKSVALTYTEFAATVPIEILELRANEKIVFSWGPSSDVRVITILLLPTEAGTRVSVKEQGFKEFEDLLSEPALSASLSYEYHAILSTLLDGKGGWTFMLTCLKAYLENNVTTLRLGLIP
ncbi:MAG: SRPBCC domain-containing protein [Streptococcaceae bacterium]|jgi:uncharacterized protein YndB with AHSA1/START domain|nr:SRPBCC domain-containing protein [Streptococcaceae bacterium]